MYNFEIYGIWLSDFLQKIDTSNLVNGKPVYYLRNSKNLNINPITYPNIGYLALVNCSNITVESLTLENNAQGLLLAYTTSSLVKSIHTNNTVRGISLCCSNSNSIIGNIAENSRYGITFYNSTNNTVFGNHLTTNYYGIQLSGSSNNKFCGNNFMKNMKQIVISRPGYANFWDDGYPSGGNYWSNYAGVDLFSGPFQNITGNDGIGDTSYIIDEYNVDRYPLMGPFNSFNTSVGYFVDIISNSTIEDFKYLELNNTIVMYVSNRTANQTTGFCRLTIPHDVISPPYTVKVNDTTIRYQTVYENHTEGISIIYFTYEHSTLEIVIIPEYPFTTTILLLLAILITILTKRKLKTRNNIKYSQT